MSELQTATTALNPNAMRYLTAGDWEDESVRNIVVLNITSACTGNWRFDALLQVHELIEAILCKHAGISQSVVDNYDTGPIGSQSDDPGDTAQAPYRKEHCFATSVERMLCAAMDLSWQQYENRLNELWTEIEECQKSLQKVA